MLRAWPLESATPLPAAPPGTCERCGCHLSKYRSLLESRCAPCQLAEPATEPEWQPGPRRDRHPPRIVLAVLAVLEAGPLGARDITTQTGLTTATVKDVLRRLRRQHLVTTRGPYRRPLYQLAARGRSGRVGVCVGGEWSQ
jgi:hypothetical protein